jgi:hypothetical protein
MVVSDLISCDLESGIELDHIGICLSFIWARDELIAGAIEENKDLLGVGAGREVRRLGDLAGDGLYRGLRSRRHLSILEIEIGVATRTWERVAVLFSFSCGEEVFISWRSYENWISETSFR